MDDGVQIAQRQSAAFQCREDPVRLIFGRRGYFGDTDLARGLVEQHQIGECATDVDPRDSHENVVRLWSRRVFPAGRSVRTPDPFRDPLLVVRGVPKKMLRRSLPIGEKVRKLPLSQVSREKKPLPRVLTRAVVSAVSGDLKK